MANTTAADRKGIAIVLGVALALRVAIPVFALAVAKPEPQFREPDTEGYLRVAGQWWRTGCFGVPGEPEIVRTPGYPLLLLPGVAADHVEAMTIGLQIVLACATVWLVYRTAILIFGDGRVALTAAWLCACEPVSIIYASKLLSETLFTTIITLAIWLLARYSISRRWRELLAAAVAVAAAAYVRPIAYFLPVWIGLALVVVFWRHAESRRRLLLKAAAFVALSMALLAPWQVRNWLEAGYAGFSAISDVNFYYYEALPILAEQQGIGPAERDEARIEAGEGNLAVYLRQHPEQADWPAARRYEFLRQESLRIIRAHPLDWARIHFSGVLHTLTDSGRNAWLGFFRLAENAKPVHAAPPRTFWQRLAAAAAQRPLVLAIHALLAAILLTYLALALAGVCASRTPAALLLLAVALYLLLVSGGDAGYHRFRVPLTPILCLFAAHGYSIAALFARGSGGRA